MGKHELGDGVCKQTLLFFALAFLLAACATQPTKQYAGAIQHAKQAGRPLVVFGIYHGTPYSPFNMKGGSNSLSAGADFITTGPTVLTSIIFEFLPYNATDNPLPDKIKRFIVRKPMPPNHVYRVVSQKAVWPDLSIRRCLKLVGMIIKSADGTITRVRKKDIDHYVTPNVVRRWSTGCASRVTIPFYPLNP
jgi:hypothetical protein